MKITSFYIDKEKLIEYRDFLMNEVIILTDSLRTVIEFPKDWDDNVATEVKRQLDMARIEIGKMITHIRYAVSEIDSLIKNLTVYEESVKLH